MNPFTITPADRVSRIHEYYFSRKLREVARLNAAGADIVSLGIGGPDRAPDRSVVDTLADEARRHDAHGYQPYNGHPQLRQAISRWYRRCYGVNVDALTEVLPLIGSKEGILHISLAFLNPGDGVLIPDPGYPTYSSVSHIVGAEVYTYNLLERNGWMPDFDEIERLPLHRIKLMWINYPNMPTGTPASPELFRRTIDFGRRHGIVIVNDNPYSMILNNRPLSIMQTEGAKETAIELNSLSKSHNMAGWRIGMAVANPEFIGWILKIKSNIDSGQFGPVMAAAARALDLGSEWYDELNDTYARRRMIAGNIMDALGCKWDRSQSGLFLWGRIPDTAPSSEAFADMVLDSARVFITPGAVFGLNGERYVRISLCATEERMRTALARIEQHFKFPSV
ncbi:MAG: aminotransferase class I/II-fold pyridoxal phosphate-dependent enzyme [Muribaculaceae bacterium]|nr:aminotransferase class I/II-fold pyridoxal phosphate-dependent enzyme [Muribaculaceae bacterium]